MKLVVTIFLFSFFSLNGYSEEMKDRKIISVGYFNKMYGHLHKNPFRYSIGLTTVSCGHPVKIYKARENKKDPYQEFFSSDWRYVKIGPYYGYIHVDNVSNESVKCFQDKYPRFFESLNLDISQMFYWGKLYDQYVVGKTRAK